MMQAENTIDNQDVEKSYIRELKMYEHNFYKADWEELDRLIKAA